MPVRFKNYNTFLVNNIACFRLFIRKGNAPHFATKDVNTHRNSTKSSNVTKHRIHLHNFVHILHRKKFSWQVIAATLFSNVFCLSRIYMRYYNTNRSILCVCVCLCINPAKLFYSGIPSSKIFVPAGFNVCRISKVKGDGENYYECCIKSNWKHIADITIQQGSA